jgi:hypothetical protein
MNKQKTIAITFGLSLAIMLLTMGAVNVSLATTSSNMTSNTSTCNGQTIPRGAGHCAKLPECDTITIGSCRDSGDISSPPSTPIVQPSIIHNPSFKSGFSHGIHDGNLANQGSVNWYILQPGKGFSFHTQTFIKGYEIGFCKVNPTGGSDADDATFSCN